MSTFFWVQVSAFSIVLASLIGVIRFKKILKSYRPFIFLVWIALANEIISRLVIAYTNNDSINNNIYTLADYCCIVLFFMFLDETNKKAKYYVLLGAGIIIWIIDNLLLHSLTEFSSYFRIIYGLIVVYLSVGKLNEVLFNEVRRSLKNATLVICIGFIIAYTYQAVLEVFGVLNLHLNKSFYVRLYYILVFVNLFTNLLFALAMLWLPTKRQFTLPY